jgi:predicted rRNA methylase YqxC with S4 and FtsJ domains
MRKSLILRIKPTFPVRRKLLTEIVGVLKAEKAYMEQTFY